MFVGRKREIGKLNDLLSRVDQDTDGKPGKAILIRGRRRVGKSRMVEEFLDRVQVPHLYFAASGRAPTEELELFRQEAAMSSLPGASLFRDVTLGSWDAALRLFAQATDDKPTVLVLDELPYITAADDGFEGTLQRAFDRGLSRRRILLVGVGSDLSMMEALNEYGRPFHQRAVEMVVPPLNPREVGALLHLGAAESFDAYLMTGGLPLICSEWPEDAGISDYLQAALADPTSALLVSAERSLAAEFPADAQARRVLAAIGAGERTFNNIATASGGIHSTSLKRALDLLANKRVVASDSPLSARPSRETRYRVVDPYLSFWLRFLGPHIDEVERGRSDRVLARIRDSWNSWRGRAAEPVLRDALARLAPPEIDLPGKVPGIVGAYWTRTNRPDVDIVVGDRRPAAKHIVAVGSIKWRDKQPFDSHDLAALQLERSAVPGATVDSQLIAVSRAGSTVEGATVFGPAELRDAYPAI